jgi:hypothetical protein
VGIALFITSRSISVEDYDYSMISAIKAKLASLNQQEQEASEGQPRYEWSCHRECFWLAFTVFQQED